MSGVSIALKQMIKNGGAEQFTDHSMIESKINELDGLSILERNLLKRCATYDLFPESIFVNESAANRAAQRLASVLSKKHGIDERQAQSFAVDVCTGFSSEDIRINVFKEDGSSTSADNKKAPVNPKTEEKPKKKGLFSFFKRG